MKKKQILIFLTIMIFVSCAKAEKEEKVEITQINNTLNEQYESYVLKEYDKDIYNYQVQEIEKKDIKVEKYLDITKPFSKWESRPLKDSILWIMGNREHSSTIPNLLWGSISRNYGKTIEYAQELPKTFSKNAYSNELAYINYFKNNMNKFKELIRLLEKSPKSIFLKQENIERVDELLKEKNKYWSYKIPKDSPFPMSNSIESKMSKRFSKVECKILEQIKILNIYAVYNSEDSIYFLIDGLFDNSFGYLHTKKSDNTNPNHLFRISYKKEIESNLYFYIAF